MDANRSDKEFDDLLRKGYEDHTIEPERALWEGINTRLYQKKIDRNIHKIRQLKIAISAAAAILAGVIIYSRIKTMENKTEIQSISEIPGTPAPAENKDSNLLKLRYNNKINDGNSADLNKTTQGKLNPESNKNKPEFIKETPVLSAQSTKPVPDSSYNHTVLLTSSEFHYTSSIKNKDIKPDTGIILQNYMKAHSLKIIKHVASVLPEIIRSDKNKSIDTKGTTLNAIRRGTEEPNQVELILPEADRAPDQPWELTTAGNGRKHTPFFIEGSVSPEISYRALLANTKYSMPDYGRAYFNKAERPDFSFSAGISGGVRITNRFILKSGAYYSRYSIKLKTYAFNVINNGSDGYLVYTSSGPVNIKLISSDSLSNESLIKSSINFSFVNVPVIAEFNLGNNYFINLGFNLNMLVGQNMNWQAENYDGNFSETAADPIDGLEFGSLSMTIGLVKEKFITRQLSILLNPSVRINLTSLNNSVPVKSYPYSWGLNSGLRYYFD
jgi:hypothetical protein